MGGAVVRSDIPTPTDQLSTGLLCLGDDGVADPDGSGLPRYFTRIKDPSEVVSALADLGLQVVDSHLVPVPRMACEFYLAFFQKPKT